MIFTMAFYVILLSCGFELLTRSRFFIVKAVNIVLALIYFYNSNGVTMVYKKFRYEEITEVLSYMREHHIPGSQFYVHTTAKAAMIYYTTINPQKDKWAEYKDAHLLNWDVNYDTLAEHIEGSAGFVFESVDSIELGRYLNGLDKYLKKTGEMFPDLAKRRFAYIYTK